MRQRKDWADRTSLRGAKNPTLEPALSSYSVVVRSECQAVADSHIDILQGNNTDFTFGAIGVRIDRNIQTTPLPDQGIGEAAIEHITAGNLRRGNSVESANLAGDEVWTQALTRLKDEPARTVAHVHGCLDRQNKYRRAAEMWCLQQALGALKYSM